MSGGRDLSVWERGCLNSEGNTTLPLSFRGNYEIVFCLFELVIKNLIMVLYFIFFFKLLWFVLKVFVTNEPIMEIIIWPSGYTQDKIRILM